MDGRKRGLLKLSPSDRILEFDDKEFGLVYVAKQSDTLVFASPPLADYQPIKNPTLQGIENKGGFPAYVIDPLKNNKEMKLVHGNLKKDEKVLAREVKGQNHVYEVVIFKATGEKKDDMPETGDGIEIINKGYVLKSQLEKPATLFKHKEGFRKIRKPVLFPNKNLIDDVKQNSFGNCFLLSSILSILNKKPGGENFVRSMMIQSQDGKYTTVRLFHPETLEPVYIRVENSLYYQDSKNQIDHKALWVHVLEKAYTAFAMKEIKNKPVYSHPSFRDMYGNGGTTEFALRILTGRKAVDTKLEDRRYPWEKRDELMTCLPMYYSLDGVFKKLGPNKITYLENLIKDISSNDERTQLLKFLTKTTTTPLDWEDYISKHHQSDTFLRYIKNLLDSKLITLDEISNFVDKYNFIADHPFFKKALPKLSLIVKFGEFLNELTLQGKVDDFFALRNRENTSEESEFDDRVKGTNFAYFHHFFTKTLVDFQTKNNLNCKLSEDVIDAFKDDTLSNLKQINPVGSGVYSKDAEKLYSDITRNIKDNVTCYTASTKQTFNRKVPGLRAGHGYAVTGAYTKNINGIDLKFIMVRNPWGRVGREYHWKQVETIGQLNAKEVENKAEFAVELNDFDECFDRCTKGHYIQPTLKDIETPEDIEASEESFLEQHWGKILVAAVIITAILVTVFTSGFGGLILGAVATWAVAMGVPATAGTAVAATTITVGVAASATIGAIGAAVVQKNCLQPQNQVSDDNDQQNSTDSPRSTTTTTADEINNDDSVDDSSEEDDIETNIEFEPDSDDEIDNKKEIVDGNEDPSEEENANDEKDKEKINKKVEKTNRQSQSNETRIKRYRSNSCPDRFFHPAPSDTNETATPSSRVNNNGLATTSTGFDNNGSK